MNESYTHQLLAIREMLKSPHDGRVQDGYNLLFDLGLECSENADFINSLVEICKEYPQLKQEFEKRINELPAKQKKGAATLQKELGLTLVIKLTDKEKPSNQGKTNSRSSINPNSQTTRKKTSKIFISYSHKDEKYKDELIKILLPLADQKHLDIWDDRRIDPGDEWYKAIEKAMSDCDIALLLISSDFLNSRFIKKVEVRQLLKRRKKDGLRVIPIIIRHCLWQEVDVLKKIQALPRDGEPVALARGKNARELIWTNIGIVLKKVIKK